MVRGGLLLAGQGAGCPGFGVALPLGYATDVRCSMVRCSDVRWQQCKDASPWRCDGSSGQRNAALS